MEQKLDLSLGLFGTVYAAWLRQHKNHEPDWTWLEVVFGVAVVLGYAHARTAAQKDAAQHQRNVWLGFVIAGVPIICGEVSQALESARARREWLRRQLGSE